MVDKKRLAEKEKALTDLMDFLADFPNTSPTSKKQLANISKALNAYPTNPTEKEGKRERLAFHCMNCLKSWVFLTIAKKAPNRGLKENAGQFIGIALEAIQDEILLSGE